MGHGVSDALSKGGGAALSFLWAGFVASVQWYWDQALLLPRVALQGAPDVGACLLHQKLQMVRGGGEGRGW